MSIKDALKKAGLVPADLGGSRPLDGSPASIDWDEYQPIPDGEQVPLGDPIHFDRA